MTRKYDSQRRAESAARTRQAIVEAAVKLHGQGVTALAAVAEEAGVSLPTVNKHFPTREDLFAACTSHLADQLLHDTPEALAAGTQAERLQKIVRHVFSLHEESFGQMWTGYKLEDESPTLVRALAEFESYGTALADELLLDMRQPEAKRGFVHAMFNPLTYRALRLKGNLSFEDAVNQMVVALAAVLDIPTD